ncbi:MAG: 50S ribosomal protein L18Ae [Candidatus Micrarchaeota archaeon]
MKFNVSGQLKFKDQKRVFEKEIEAKSEKDARDKTYALFGSTNRLSRREVIIGKVQKVA